MTSFPLSFPKLFGEQDQGGGESNELLGDAIFIYFMEGAQSCPHDPAALHTDVQSWTQKTPSTWLLGPDPVI